MIKITGLDSLQKTISDARKALDAVNGKLVTLTFNPQNPSSVEAAIVESERLVDERLGVYAKNKIIGPLIQQMKEVY